MYLVLYMYCNCIQADIQIFHVNTDYVLNVIYVWLKMNTTFF